VSANISSSDATARRFPASKAIGAASGAALGFVEISNPILTPSFQHL
jgi:hypothetical protein